MAELVVLPALLLVGEQVPGLLDLLELRRGLWSLVQVRMELLGQLAMRLTQLLRGGGSGDAQDLVRIPRHARQPALSALWNNSYSSAALRAP